MINANIIGHLPIKLRPDPARVVIRPFVPADDPLLRERPRAQWIADCVLALDKDALGTELARVSASLAERHGEVPIVLVRRYPEVNGLLINPSAIDQDRSLLIGAYFSEEYAFEAAALQTRAWLPIRTNQEWPKATFDLCFRCAASERGMCPH